MGAHVCFLITSVPCGVLCAVLTNCVHNRHKPTYAPHINTVGYSDSLPEFSVRGTTPKKVLLLLRAQEGNAGFFQSLLGECVLLSLVGAVGLAVKGW